jgi:uncharacterized protein GlcG (DUF336 family)
MRWFNSLWSRSRKQTSRKPSQRLSRKVSLTIETLETRNLLSASTSQAFVTRVFLDLLGRNPDTVGLNYWSSLVDQGISRAQVALKIEGSEEFHTDEVQNLFGQLLHRNADPSGLAHWVAFLDQGGTAQQLEARIIGSDEYFANRGGGTVNGFLQAAYNDVLGRNLDPAGGQFWSQALANGRSQTDVAAGILGSVEALQNEINNVYLQFLGRPVDASGLATFTALLQNGGTDEQLVADVIGSDEFSGGAVVDPLPVTSPTTTLTASQVSVLLSRAAAASSSNDAIIAVVDRAGHPLGIRVESGVDANITSNTANLVFAVDGALAEARTAAFFANNQAPLTSRTVEFISQTTITQREVESNPSITDPNSPLRGPGFVAPIEVGGHFPPKVQDTPPVDLFGIENTNRDSILHPGPSQIKGVDDVNLAALGDERFAINLANVPAGQQMSPPESFGFVSGLEMGAQPRGIGTLPGGIPLYNNGVLVGGIGVFFPGKTGFADEENSAIGLNFDPTKRDRSEEAEFMAFAAGGGSSGAGYPVGTLAGIPPLPGFDLPFGRIDLAGVTLDIVGPGGNQGPANLAAFGSHLGVGDPNSGVNEPLFPGDTTHAPNDPAGTRDGAFAPEGWLVTPHAGGGLTAADVAQIITQGITEANITRAQIRLPLGRTTKMVFAVSDGQGNVLGMYRMPDATIFSEDVAVAKSRNVAYYNDPNQLQPADQIAGLPKGVAFTNRTFRFLAQPRYPEGQDGTPPAPFSVLNDGGSNLLTGLNTEPPLPASAFTSVLGHDAFNPETNFHQPFSLNQNGIVFFPGSSGVYKLVNGVPTLVGGFGVSGDGVDQDDVVTANGIVGFQAPSNLTADNFAVRNVFLPYQKFPRNPEML